MSSNAEFGESTPATLVASTYSNEIKGKTIVVTGVSPNSLGESMALAFASQNPALLILASRTHSKLQAVVYEVLRLHPGTNVRDVVVDLSSQTSVRIAATEIKSHTEKIDILVNNAGVMIPSREMTSEGFELQLATNHLGPFLLTILLVPLLLASASSSPPGTTRVVNVTSAGHRISPFRFHDYNFDGNPIPEEEMPVSGLPAAFMPKPGQGAYSGFYAYGQSKSANILFALGLKRKFRLGAGREIQAFACHPGSIWTDLSRHLDEEMTGVIGKTGTHWKSCDQGASTMLVAALDPKLSDSNAVYLSDCQVADVAPHASDPDISDRFWDVSENLVKERVRIE